MDNTAIQLGFGESTNSSITLGKYQLAYGDNHGIHLHPTVDIDGEPIATKSELLALRHDFMSTQYGENFDLISAFVCSVFLVGAVASLLVAMSMFSRAFVLRRWISRARRRLEKQNVDASPGNSRL